MSKNRSVWKNTAEGQTVRRNSVATYYSSRPMELMESFALRVLSRAAHLALLRIEIELRRHGGCDNGKLIVTKEQFVEFGIHPRMVAPALRELEALGIIIITVRGRGGNAEHRQPNRFRLNFMCGAIDDTDPFRDPWKRFKTLKEADEVASMARDAKDPSRVNYGRLNAGRKNIFRVHKVTLEPGAQSDPENPKFPGAQSDPTVQVHKVTPLSIVSGREDKEAKSNGSDSRPAPAASPSDNGPAKTAEQANLGRAAPAANMVSVKRNNGRRRSA